MSSRHLCACGCVRVCERACACISCCGCISPTDDIRALQQSEGEVGFLRKLKIIHPAASGHVQAQIQTIIKSGREALLPRLFSLRAVTVHFFSEAGADTQTALPPPPSSPASHELRPSDAIGAERIKGPRGAH